MSDREDLAALIYEVIDREEAADFYGAHTSPTSCDKAADAILAAGWRPPERPPPAHHVDGIERVAVCDKCMNDVHWDDDTDEWKHL